MSRHYEIIMSNGDTAEADSILGVLTAAATMHEDSDGTAHPDIVRINGNTELWITRAARNHVMEVNPRKPV